MDWFVPEGFVNDVKFLVGWRGSWIATRQRMATSKQETMLRKNKGIERRRVKVRLDDEGAADGDWGRRGRGKGGVGGDRGAEGQTLVGCLCVVGCRMCPRLRGSLYRTAWTLPKHSPLRAAAAGQSPAEGQRD